MRVSPAIDQYLAGIDNVGDELYRNINGIARQIGTDDKPDFKIDRIDAHIAFDVERGGGKARFVIDDGGFDLVRNFAHPGFVNRAVGYIGKTKIQYRLARILGLAHIDRRFERDGVEQSFEVARHLPPQHRFGDHLAHPQPAAGHDAVTGLVTDFRPLLGVLGLVSGAKYVHHRRAKTRLAADTSHGHPDAVRTVPTEATAWRKRK